MLGAGAADRSRTHVECDAGEIELGDDALRRI
jgi:hypothetical protein